MTGKIFKAGNSNAIIIPQPLLQEWGVDTGEELTVEKVPDSEAILVFPTRKKTKSNAVSSEFNKWIDTVLKEDADLLDDLAER